MQQPEKQERLQALAQRRAHHQRQENKEQGLAALMLSPLLVAQGLGLRWASGFGLALATLVLLMGAGAFVFLWRLNSTSSLYPRWRTYAWLYVLLAPLVSGNVAVLSLVKLFWSGVNVYMALLLGGLAGAAVSGAALWLLSQHQPRLEERPEEPQLPPADLEQAKQRIVQGWGLTLEEAQKEGFLFFGVGVLCCCTGPVVGLMLILPSEAATQLPQSVVYLLGGMLLLLTGPLAGIVMTRWGLRYLRYWHTWRHQAEEVFVVEGRLEAVWDFRELVNSSRQARLVNILLPTGAHRLLVIGAAFANLVLEPGNTVRIEYLSGSEIVTNVDTRTVEPDEVALPET